MGTPRQERQRPIHIIQQEASVWALVHILFAFAAVLLAASALVMLSLHSWLTASLAGQMGWSLLAVSAILGAGLGVMEATVQGDAALAGDPETFSMWFALSRGFEHLSVLFPVAFAPIAWMDLRARAADAALGQRTRHFGARSCISGGG